MIIKCIILISSIFLAAKSFIEREDKVKLLFFVIWCGIFAVVLILTVR